jgi:hypothetical protein
MTLWFCKRPDIIQKLNKCLKNLSESVGVLQFIRSGRVAITRSKVERLSDMLEGIQKNSVIKIDPERKVKY